MLKRLRLHRNLNSLYFQHKALAEEPTNRAFESSNIFILTGEVSEKREILSLQKLLKDRAQSSTFKKC